MKDTDKQWELQSEINIQLRILRKQVLYMDFNGNAIARKEILKKMIELLVEQL